MRTFYTLAAIGALMLAAPVAAQTLETQPIPVDKLFPYLDKYLALPVGKRDHFHLDYVLSSKGKLPELRMALNGHPITVDAGGRLTPLPTLENFKNHDKIMFAAPKGAAFSLVMNIAPTVEAAQIMDARALKLSVQQAHDTVKAEAGILAMAAPDLQSVCFEGAKSGTLTTADGKSLALLTTIKAGEMPLGTPCFTPVDYPTATQITLDRVPVNMLIARRIP